MNLLEQFNLTDRIAFDSLDEKIIERSIDYSDVNKKIRVERKKSLLFLKEAIQCN